MYKVHGTFAAASDRFAICRGVGEIISNWEQVIDWERRGKVDTCYTQYRGTFEQKEDQMSLALLRAVWLTRILHTTVLPCIFRFDKRTLKHN